MAVVLSEAGTAYPSRAPRCTYSFTMASVLLIFLVCVFVLLVFILYLVCKCFRVFGYPIPKLFIFFIYINNERRRSVLAI